MPPKSEVRLSNLENNYSTILQTLAKMDEKMTGLDETIRGNGKPGLVTVQTEHELRLKSLEESRKGVIKNWQELVVLILSGGVIALVTALMQHFIAR